MPWLTLQLAEDALDISHQSWLFGLVESNAIHGCSLKILWRVDPSLVEDAVDGTFEEFHDDRSGSTECDGTVLGLGKIGIWRGGGGKKKEKRPLHEQVPNGW